MMQYDNAQKLVNALIKTYIRIQASKLAITVVLRP